MPSIPAAASEAAHAPATSWDLMAALEAWRAAVGSAPRGHGPIHLEKKGESVTVTADLEALRRRKAALELAEDSLHLRLEAGERTIPLWFFNVRARAEGAKLTIILSPRSAQLVRESLHRSFEPDNRELWPGIVRMLNAAESTPLRGALVARLVKAVADVTENVDDAVAAEAVSESSDPLTLVRVLEQPEILDELRRADPLAPARLRGITARQQLIDMAGGVLSSGEAADALGLTRQAIDKRRRAGKLLAISAGKRGYRYPAFQFASGGVLSGLEPVLNALEAHDPWMQLSFLVNPNSDLNAESPVALLHKGDVEAVVRSAAAFGEHGAA